jgi:hypothetical protein
LKNGKLVERLADGSELWSWDDVGPLCGSAGYAVVKDGKVLKAKVTTMA